MAKPSAYFPSNPNAASRPLWFIYLSAALFFLLRTPYEVIHGLVEGEEGTVYLRYAWDSPALRAFFAPHQGYYSLLPNLCGVIAARILPLRFAGHFFVFCELAVHMLLAYMIVQCENFTTVRQKALAVAVGLLTYPTIAIVLCTDNAQFFLAVMSGILLISDPERLRTGRLLALIFAGLNGVLSCFLLPFFLFRAWVERTRARIIQAAALSGCTALQAAAVLSHGSVPMGQHSTPGYFAGAFLVNSPLSQFFTHWSAQEACRAVGSPKLIGWQGALWFSLELGSLLYLAFLLVLLWKAGSATRLLGAAAVSSLALSLIRGGTFNYDLMCGSGARYFFIFNLLTGLGLVIVQSRTSGFAAGAARALVILSLLCGILDVISIAKSPRSPIWSQEVALWRDDPSHRLQIGPGAWPGVRLTPQPGNKVLPTNIYDSTIAGWQDR